MDARSTGIRQRQQGMALVIGLIILLIMTLISITAMEGTLMQERMAGAFQSRQIALQSAEAALRRAEAHLDGSLPDFADSSPGFFHHKKDSAGNTPPDWSEPAGPIQANDVLTYNRNFEDVARDPLYFIEMVGMACRAPDLEAGTPKEKHSFRIMALGFGTSANTRVALETYYCR